jgi:hypothetical protein
VQILPDTLRNAGDFLDFLRGTSPALVNSMFDHLGELEDIQAEVRRVIAMLRENEAELTAEGFDVEANIAEIQDQFAQTVKTYCEADRAHDEYLHACADLADAEDDYFKSLCDMMDPLAKENPKDPLARQWKELRPLLSSKPSLNN